MNRQTIFRVLTALDARDPGQWADELHAPCAAYGITTRLRAAAFLATIVHETRGLSVLVESLDYAPARLMEVWPARFDGALARQLGRTAGQAADQRAIAERAYGGRMGNGPEGSGDGWRFRGRGLIQITGRTNYENAARALQVPLGELPDWMQTRHGAAVSAAWWWAANGCNELADAGAVGPWRLRVNGGLNGLGQVSALYDRSLAAMQAEAA